MLLKWQKRASNRLVRSPDTLRYSPTIPSRQHKKKPQRFLGGCVDTALHLITAFCAACFWNRHFQASRVFLTNASLRAAVLEMGHPVATFRAASSTTPTSQRAQILKNSRFNLETSLLGELYREFRKNLRVLMTFLGIKAKIHHNSHKRLKCPNYDEVSQLPIQCTRSRGLQLKYSSEVETSDIFKRDWTFQASHPPNPYFCGEFSRSRLYISSEIENFKRKLEIFKRSSQIAFFSRFGPFGFDRLHDCQITRLHSSQKLLRN